MGGANIAQEFREAEERRAGRGTGREAERIRKRREAKESFWAYEQLMNPRFFRGSRPHLKKIADTLQAVYQKRVYKTSRDDLEWTVAESPEAAEETMRDCEAPILCRKIMLNVPPRHGKSYSVANFVQWSLGDNNENRIIAATYNETLAGRFSTQVRDGIDATKLDDSLNIFSDVFPATRIKDGDASKQIWSLEGQFFNYLGTGFGGTITGIGCNIGIIDDPVKNNKEAFNKRILDEQFSWYTDTFLSRIEEGGMQILIMTRWSTNDLAGRLLASEEAPEWYELKLQACLNEVSGEMLCPELLSYESYKKKKALTNVAIFEANYQQKPVDVQGALYSSFKTYEHVPLGEDGNPLFEQVKAYVDTADTGEDYLCCIVYGVYDMEAYVLDVLYTQAPMEETEQAVAASLYFNCVDVADIESNNGGRGFARNVERILKETYHSNRCVINWFTQSQNKESRIRAASTWVMQHIYYPASWMYKWPEYHIAMITYQAKGKNDHDDAQDATTGVAEKTGYDDSDEWLF